MKKISMGVMLLSIILLGTGYAYWSNGVEINASISTGQLLVEWEKCQQTEVYKGAMTEWKDGSIEGNVAKASISDIYPGGGASYYATAENKGTIPVKVEDIKIEAKDSEQGLVEEIYFSGYYTFYPKGDEDDNTYYNIEINPGKKGLSVFNQTLQEKLVELNAYDMVPGSDIHFRVDMRVAGGIDNKYQDQNLCLETTINWSQYNE